jgi:PBP1b-binding outer membrane lipoprotein LpoB
MVIRMKKIISIFIFLLLLVGCSLSNTPTSKVEDLLTKYQTLDKDIVNGINSIIEEENFTSIQKDRYKKIIEKQYKNLTYEIKNERIDGETAVITTEIEVIDYKKVVNEVNNKYQGNTNYTVQEYNNTKLDYLEKAKDKVTYTIDFEVKKDNDGNWKLSSLSNETIKKIQGMY